MMLADPPTFRHIEDAHPEHELDSSLQAGLLMKTPKSCAIMLDLLRRKELPILHDIQGNWECLCRVTVGSCGRQRSDLGRNSEE